MHFNLLYLLKKFHLIKINDLHTDGDFEFREFNLRLSAQGVPGTDVAHLERPFLAHRMTASFASLIISSPKAVKRKNNLLTEHGTLCSK